MADETIIRLTDEQKKQMKAATGQEHEEFKVETLGSKLTPRVAPRRVQRLAAKAVAKRTAPKRTMAKKAAPKRTMAKKAAPKRTMAKKAAPKRTMAKKAAPKMY